MRALLARASRVVSGKTAKAAKTAKAPLVESLESRQLLSTYYVSSSGSDSASGTSTGSAWRSTARVNSATLKSGDKVLFQGGKSFSGSLALNSKETGVTFSTYGSGRATISSGSKTAFDLGQTSGINISNLNIVGNGMYSNSSFGIYVHADGGRHVSGFNFSNLDVHGYGREGIRFVAGGSGTQVNNVKVTNVDSHDNKWGGVKANAPGISQMYNYTIDHVKVWNNYGDRGDGGVTGNGIMLEGVYNAKISRSVAHHNGKDGAAPVGIWGARGHNITIEYCESYANNTRTATDGGGFDFDWDVKSSTIQYCYSHDNAGPGFILAGGSHLNSGNTIRYNVSQNDGRENGRAGMQIWGNVQNCNIYNNTVYITPTGNSNTAGFYAHDGGGVPKPKNVNVYNNVFYTTGGVKLLNISNGVAATSGSLNFRGNCYYSGGNSFKIQWGGSSYSSLTAWRSAKGQEKLNGSSTGYQGDPKFVAAGKGQTIGNADSLRSLTAYKLQSSSPLINKGVSQPGTLAGATIDFWGDSLPKGGKYDIGVDEVA
jgi:hypothetical protein